MQCTHVHSTKGQGYNCVQLFDPFLSDLFRKSCALRIEWRSNFFVWITSCTSVTVERSHRPSEDQVRYTHLLPTCKTLFQQLITVTADINRIDLPEDQEKPHLCVLLQGTQQLTYKQQLVIRPTAHCWVTYRVSLSGSLTPVRCYSQVTCSCSPSPTELAAPSRHSPVNV